MSLSDATETLSGSPAIEASIAPIHLAMHLIAPGAGEQAGNARRLGRSPLATGERVGPAASVQTAHARLPRS
jgi:hypothetical protein